MSDDLSTLDRYILSPFPTLLATCALIAVFHESGSDGLAEITFVGWFVNFYFWYKRNYRK